MIPDPYEKKVLIPVKIVDGKVEYFYGGPLPELKEGTIGDLLIPRYAVLNNNVLELLEKEEAVELLPLGSHLRALVTIRNELASDQTKYFIRAENIQQTGYLVQIVLKETLKLRLRGTKKGELLDCRCSIPALSDREADSLNQAYTLISQKFEPLRKSHSGNVFAKVFSLDAQTKWRPLKELRDALEAKYEKERLIKKP